MARGYQRGARPAGPSWSPDGDGAFAPMGGVFSCVRDLAGWVTGLAAGFPAGAEADGGPHPLRRASRREMQLPQVALPPYHGAAAARRAGLGSQLSYGFGLFVEEHPAWGRLVFHGGGYPGFGSHMRWHPASGLAVIVLANSTYAAAHPLAGKLLDALLRAAPAPPAGQPRTRGPVPAPGAPWPETIAAQQAVDELLRSWDDAAADRIFTPNVAQDEPYAVRREKAALTWQRLGPPGRRRGPPGRVRLPRPAALVAARRARRRGGGDQAHPGGPAAGPVPLPGRPAGLGWPALAAHPGTHFFAQRQYPRLARRPPGR